MTIGTQRVPFEGPDTYNIMAVGEAPGATEVGQGRPFVGRSGQHLERYLEKNLIERHEIKLTNLSKYRPGTSHNKFEALIGPSKLEEGLDERAEEVNRVKPNVILALGNGVDVTIGGRRAGGSDGKSEGFINPRSEVRVLPSPFSKPLFA